MDEQYKKLLQASDEHLFLNGGCHVFALALHERFRYPLVCVRESSSNCVPHVYCRVDEYAIDVIGFTVEKQILDAKKWNVHPFSAIPVTPFDLQKYYVNTFPCPGLYADDSFMSQAGLRANKRITDCISFYDGT